MREKVIIVGDGGHAKILIDILHSMKEYEVLGVTSINNTQKTFYGVPVLGNDDILDEYFKKNIKNIALGIGGFTDNAFRTLLYERFTNRGFNIINTIHPKSVISKSVTLGKGVVIFAGVILNAEVKIGNNVIIATGSTIDHESIINDHSLISAGVTIGANTIIEESSLCALGSKVISGITIGRNVLVAAGAVVVNNIENNSKVYGVPAKKK